MPSVFTSPNTRISFRCKQILGRGVFGTVYLVESPTTQYAMKVIQCKTASAAARAEAKQEVDILKSNSIGHHNIIRYRDSWFRGSDMCILMEYAPNGTLDDMLKRRMRESAHFEEIEVTHFLRQLSSALSYCHDILHVIHRDLKPANVMVDQFGVLKLGDFGVSKRLAGVMSFAATQAGTPLYMPPEMAQGSRYSYAADVWMLGCMLYELMVFYTPFSPPHAAASSVQELLVRVATQPVAMKPLTDRYSRELCRVVAWMLGKIPEQRPTMRQVLALFDIKPPPAEVAPDLAASAAQIQAAFRQSRAKRQPRADPFSLAVLEHGLANIGRPPTPVQDVYTAAAKGDVDTNVGTGAHSLSPYDSMHTIAAAEHIQLVLRKSFEKKRHAIAAKATEQVAALQRWRPAPVARPLESEQTPINHARVRRHVSAVGGDQPRPPRVSPRPPRAPVPLPDLQFARISRLAEPRFPAPVAMQGGAVNPGARAPLALMRQAAVPSRADRPSVRPAWV